MKKRCFKIAIFAVLIFVFSIAFFLVYSRFGLRYSTYRIEWNAIGVDAEKVLYSTSTSVNCENDSLIRIIQISDLHNSEFGRNNSRFIEYISIKEPDLILITGDILNANEDSYTISTNVITSLSRIAPVYISFGNHEVEYESQYGVDIKSLYESAGATVLDSEYIDIEVNGQPIRLGGVYGYCLPEKYLEGAGDDRIAESAFVSEFQDTDSYTILMCHMPVCWLLNEGLDEWDVDLVFSGHVHGGQVIFPNGSGLYAPDFGWFPGKLYGVYDSTDGLKHLVLSRGLGSTEAVPRINNAPEIVVTDIIPEK